MERVISGGQTGADRGGLDAAIDLGIPHGGFCPKGRLAEDGTIPERYGLEEIASASYEARTRKNVEAADATVVFVRGKPTRGSTLTVEHAKRTGRPVLVIDLNASSSSGACAALDAFLRRVQPRVLNVAGSRESQAPGMAASVRTIVARVLRDVLARGKLKRVRDLAGALALLEARRVLTLTDQPGFVSLVSAVTGEKVSGSWWGHRRGKLVYAVATALGDHPDVLGCKLVRGRAAFLHRAAWPALLRVVTDDGWRRRKLATLPRGTVRTVRRVEEGAEPARLDKRDKAALEASALLHVSSEHTTSGAHRTVWKTWRVWAPAEVLASAAALDLGEAQRELSAIGLEL